MITAWEAHGRDEDWARGLAGVGGAGGQQHGMRRGRCFGRADLLGILRASTEQAASRSGQAPSGCTPQAPPVARPRAATMGCQPVRPPPVSPSRRCLPRRCASLPRPRPAMPRNRHAPTNAACPAIPRSSLPRHSTREPRPQPPPVTRPRAATVGCQPVRPPSVSPSRRCLPRHWENRFS